MPKEARVFTMLWPWSYCAFLRRAGAEGDLLRFVWGGHNLPTSFSWFKVMPGDTIVPVLVRHKTVFVIAQMRVAYAMARSDYVAMRPVDDVFILHNCANEVLVGDAGSPMRFDRPLPGEILESLRYRSAKRERGLKYLDKGVLKFGMKGSWPQGQACKLQFFTGRFRRTRAWRAARHRAANCNLHA